MKTPALYQVPNGKLHVQDTKDYVSSKYRCGKGTAGTDERVHVERLAGIKALFADGKICKGCLRGTLVGDFKIR